VSYYFFLHTNKGHHKRLVESEPLMWRVRVVLYAPAIAIASKLPAKSDRVLSEKT
jgi:hypothetical protein